jgi:hypothetical protein
VKTMLAVRLVERERDGNERLLTIHATVVIAASGK